MSENIIKKEMDRQQLKEFWNELKAENMDCGYYWLDDDDHPELRKDGEGMPEFPCEGRKFIVESCWYKKNEKSVEIRFAGGRYIVTTVEWGGKEPENVKEYFVATQKEGRILFSDIINEEDGSIKKIVFVGFNFKKEGNHDN